MGPHPAVARVRYAVRQALVDLEPGALALVACSGGADSMALAAATAFEARNADWSAGAITVDHGLQEGSADRAARLVGVLRGRGLDPVEAVRVTCSPGHPVGPEGAARLARYTALTERADALGADAVLLAHSRDDQAETVLLGLARGSGARSLSGMAPRLGRYRRPLLAFDRAELRTAAEAEDLPVWDDPHNADPSFTRVRVRAELLPALEDALGPGMAAALARTADLLRADADALDAWAARAADRAAETASSGQPGALAVDVLAELPEAVRRRVLRAAALEAGCPGGALTAGHVAELDALVTAWRGQVRVELPGRVHGVRRDGLLLLERAV